jgi:hypothetical protein
VEDVFMSRKHALLRRAAGGGLQLACLGRSNRVHWTSSHDPDGKVVKVGDASVALSHGDRLKLGKTVLLFQVPDAHWRDTRHRRWQEEQQHADPGLRPALLRLAFASLLMQRERRDLPGDVVGEVCAAVESALRFCGVLT